MQIMKALILCTGEGMRLRPITLTLPKGLIPIANKPLIYYAIDSLINVNIKNIGIIVSNGNMEVFRKALKKYENIGVNFEYIIQRKTIGLVNAVEISKKYLDDENFIMIFGDDFYEVNLKSFIHKFENSKSNCQVLLNRVNALRKFGVANVKYNRVEDIIHKSINQKSHMAITGIYVFDKNIFKACQEINSSSRGEYEITDAIKWLINNGYKVTYDITQEYWKNISKPNDLIEANQYILKKLNKKVFGCIENSKITGNVYIGPNTVIKNSIIRGPAIIGNSCFIYGSYIGPYVSIKSHVKIENTEIENSIILDRCIIKDINTIIDESIIDRDCIIENKNICRKASSFILGKESKIIL